MFKIAFIHPGYENLGIEYLSAGLKRKGFHTRLFLDPILFSESGFIDNQLLSNLFSYKKRLKNQLIDYKPDLICLSVITDNYTCRALPDARRAWLSARAAGWSSASAPRAAW